MENLTPNYPPEPDGSPEDAYTNYLLRQTLLRGLSGTYDPSWMYGPQMRTEQGRYTFREP